MDAANAFGKLLQDESSLAASRTRSRLQHSLILFKGISKSMTNICPALLTMITGRPCFDRILSLNCWRAFTLSIVSVMAANSSNASWKRMQDLAISSSNRRESARIFCASLADLVVVAIDSSNVKCLCSALVLQRDTETCFKPTAFLNSWCFLLATPKLAAILKYRLIGQRMSSFNSPQAQCASVFSKTKWRRIPPVRAKREKAIFLSG